MDARNKVVEELLREDPGFKPPTDYRWEGGRGAWPFAKWNGTQQRKATIRVRSKCGLGLCCGRLFPGEGQRGEWAERRPGWACALMGGG